MKTLRSAVIGLGRIGWEFHIPTILRHEGFELVAVADPVAERVNEAKSEFGVKGYLGHEEMFEAEQLDVVVIASPTPFHADQAIAAFESGVDVFCEKPMAVSLAETDRMIASMEKYGRKLMVFQPHRAGSDVVALRHILRQDLIGDVYMIKRAETAYVRRNDWQAFGKYGGGMLSNIGAHFIDQFLYLVESRADRISCISRTVASLGDAEDVVKVAIETENGIILDLDINMASAHPMRPWQILGKRGSIILDEEKHCWQVRFFQEEDLADVKTQSTLAATGREYSNGETIPWQEKIFPITDFEFGYFAMYFPPVNFYDKCYEYFALDGEPFVSVAQSRELMRVLDECRKSASGG